MSPITPFSESGRPVTIEETGLSNHSYGIVLLSILDSEIVELGNPGLPGTGGSDGDLGGDVGIWRGT